MRHLSLLIVTLLLNTLLMAQTQSDAPRLPRLPSVEIKTTDHKTIKTDELSNNGKPMIISFWALWCKPCIKELNTIAPLYEDWVEETGVRFIAVSIDDARSSSRVKPFADGKKLGF